MKRISALLRGAHKSGSLYLVAGAGGALTCGWLYVKQRERDEERRWLNHEIERLRRDQARIMREKRENATFSDAQPIFSATVQRRVHDSVGFDGPAALTDVHVGDTVHILAADVGPQEAYHMCRNDTGEGLYPKAYLVRLPSR